MSTKFSRGPDAAIGNREARRKRGSFFRKAVTGAAATLVAVSGLTVPAVVGATSASAADACVIDSATITVNPTSFDDTAFVEPIQLDGTLHEERTSVKPGLLTTELKISDSAQPGDELRIDRALSASAGLSEPWLTMVWPGQLTHSDGTVLAERSGSQNHGVYKLTAAIADYPSDRTLRVVADSMGYGYNINTAVITGPPQLVGSNVTAQFSTCDGTSADYRINIVAATSVLNSNAIGSITPDRTQSKAFRSLALPTAEQHGFIRYSFGDGKSALSWNGIVNPTYTVQSEGADKWSREVERSFTEVTGNAALKPGEYRVVRSADSKTITVEVYENQLGDRTRFDFLFEQVGDFPAPVDGQRFVGLANDILFADGTVYAPSSLPAATFADPAAGGKVPFLDPEGTGDGTFRPVVLDTQKVRNGSGSVRIGDVVEYKLTVKNTEERRDAFDVVVTDTPPAGLEFVSASDGGRLVNGEVVWPAANIKAGAEIVRTTSMRVTPDAVGSLQNLVSAAGQNACTDTDSISVCEDDYTVEVKNPGIRAEKTGRAVDFNQNDLVGDAGDKIEYKITAFNTGDTVLSTIKLDDAKLGIKDQECLTPGATLAPNGSTTCVGTFEHTITEEEAARGFVQNDAVLKTPGAPDAPARDVTVTTPRNPGVETVKTAEVTDANGNDLLGDAGDEISYTVTAKNIGNATEKSVVLNDELLGLKDVELLAKGETLPAGESIEWKSEKPYVITDEDAALGSVVNVATVQVPGTDPVPGEVETPVTPRVPGIETVKTADVADTNEDGIVGTAGDQVTYTVTATNTGNASEHSVVLNDELLGAKDIELMTDGAKLKAGESVAWQSEPYTITEEDAEAGFVTNVATVQVPGLDPVPGEVTTDAWAPKFDFVKHVNEVLDANENGVVGDPGDQIEYAFHITNTGNMPLSTVKISDPLLGIESQEALAVDDSEGAAEGALVVLPVRGTVDAVGEFVYEITAADAEAGKVVNTATATSPGAPDQEDSVTTPVKAAPVAPAEPGQPEDPKGAVTGDPLANTGANGMLLVTGIALLLIAAGTAATLMRRRSVRAGAAGTATPADETDEAHTA